MRRRVDVCEVKNFFQRGKKGLDDIVVVAVWWCYG